MNVYLPVPYPDELLCSMIARYASRIHAKNLRVVMFAVFNKIDGTVALDLPNSIATMSERSFWSLNDRDIIYNTTLFPYYTKYLPTENLAGWFQKLLLPNCYFSPLIRRGLKNDRVKLPHHVAKGCWSCKLEDEARYGEAYLHRAHQLPGVMVCPEHGQPLFEVDVRNAMKRTNHFFDVNQLDPRLISTV